MKISRFRVTVLVLLAATTVYAVALQLDIQRYEAWKRSYLQNHPVVAPWIDFQPYVGTPTGGLLLVVGVLLGGSFLVVVIYRKNLKSAS